MADQKLTHGPKFQMEVLRLMMTDLGFCAKACSYLKEGFFAGRLKWFFTEFKQLYTDFKKSPTSAAVSNHINLFEYKEIKSYQDDFDEIQKCQPDKDHILKELTGFVRNNIFVETFQEAAEIFNAGSKEGAYEFTARKMRELEKATFVHHREFTFGDAEDVREKAREEAKNAIPTGLKAIDQAITGGGLLPGTWTTFLGGSNSGKSMLCPNLAFAAAKAGKKTFCTIHEDEEIPTKLRYLSRFSGIPYSRLILPKGTLSAEEELTIKVADEFLQEYVRLSFMYSGNSTIEDVKEEARLMHMDWKFGLFLCDYGQCLTTKAFKSLDNTRLLQEYVYHELKQLCLELNVAGAGGAQVNRQGHATAKAGSDLLRCTDVGESWGIVKKSSNVITINRSNEDVKNERMTFLLDKVRNGICPVAVHTATDFSRCTTHSNDLNQSIMSNELKLEKVEYEDPEETRKKMEAKKLYR